MERWQNQNCLGVAGGFCSCSAELPDGPKSSTSAINIAAELPCEGGKGKKNSDLENISGSLDKLPEAFLPL